MKEKQKNQKKRTYFYRFNDVIDIQKVKTSRKK